MRSGRDVSREKETEIAETAKLPQDYELVIVGTPVWAGKITPAVRIYLKRNNLAGKKVAVFVAMGGDNPEKILTTMKQLLPDSTIVGELALQETLKNRERLRKENIKMVQRNIIHVTCLSFDKVGGLNQRFSQSFSQKL